MPRSVERNSHSKSPPFRVGGFVPIPSLFDLTGRVALVTGASRGLGAAMAEALILSGADVILWARNPRLLKRQAKRFRCLTSLSASPKVRSQTPQILAQPVDVTNHRAVRAALHAALKQFHRIDILINNAGIWGGDPALNLSRRSWDAVVETDFTSVFFVSQAVAPVMVRHGYGKIIHVSSTSGVIVHPDGAVYGSVKAALIHLTRIMAMEWGPYGLRVNAIAPGVFRTDMTRSMFADRCWAKKRQAELPLGRFGEPRDIAGLAVFLASQASDHVTGETIVIDGGASLVR